MLTQHKKIHSILDLQYILYIDTIHSLDKFLLDINICFSYYDIVLLYIGLFFHITIHSNDINMDIHKKS